MKRENIIQEKSKMWLKPNPVQLLYPSVKTDGYKKKLENHLFRYFPEA
ncbi:MAG: hypothetical protein WC199_09900 [Dysgonamonadaceae bacterium]